MSCISHLRTLFRYIKRLKRTFLYFLNFLFVREVLHLAEAHISQQVLFFLLRFLFLLRVFGRQKTCVAYSSKRRFAHDIVFLRTLKVSWRCAFYLAQFIDIFNSLVVKFDFKHINHAFNLRHRNIFLSINLHENFLSNLDDIRNQFVSVFKHLESYVVWVRGVLRESVQLQLRIAYPPISLIENLLRNISNSFQVSLYHVYVL